MIRRIVQRGKAASETGIPQTGYNSHDFGGTDRKKELELPHPLPPMAPRSPWCSKPGWFRTNRASRRKWLAFIVIELDWSVEKVHDQYRRRFGVECSYWSLRRLRAITRSRNPALRFFLLTVGLLLINVWAFLRWEFAQLIAPDPRRVNAPLFRFHRFTRLLIRAVEQRYGVLMSPPAYRSPQSVIY